MRTPPRHWASAEQPAHVDGRDIRLRIWGSSSTSDEDARAAARTRLQAILAAGGPGRGDAAWYYPRGPLREELLEEIRDGAGTLLATITRNRYGAQILSTDAVLIADVDLPVRRLPARRPEPRGSLLDRILRRAPAQEATARALFEEFVAAHPDLGVQVHRTRAGFRVLVTGAAAEPGGERAQQLLEELGSDPLYVTLCRSDGSFRARLTPKPWRAGTAAPRVSWPARAPAEAERLRAWVQDYERCCGPFAVTRRESAHGPAPSASERQVIDLHDRLSRADSGLPLA